MNVSPVNINTQKPVVDLEAKLTDFKNLRKSDTATLNEYSNHDYSGRGTLLGRQRNLKEQTRGYHANNWSLTAVEIKNKLGKLIGLENSLIFNGKKVKVNEYTDINGKVHSEVSVRTFKKPKVKDVGAKLKKLF